MNLMFRKNFREQKSSGMASKVGKSVAGRHTSKRSSREQGYSPMDEHHYRTHLFFSPPRSSYMAEEEDESPSTEPRCGPMTGAGGEPLMQSTISPPMTESDFPQPLVVRSPSVSMLKWPQTPSPTKTTPTRQVSFNNYGKDNNNENNRSLSNLDRDCFIIPVHSLDRFLPEGVPLPKPLPNGNSPDKKNANLHVMEVQFFSAINFETWNRWTLKAFLAACPELAGLRTIHMGKPVLDTHEVTAKAPKDVVVFINTIDDILGFEWMSRVPDPKLCILCHLMSPLEPVDPVLESPLVQPLFKQRLTAGELFNEIGQSKTALTGMLLANMERNSEFPFVTYYVINSNQTNPVMFYNNIRTASLTKFDPRTIKYTAAHTLDLYTEVASICRPPIHEIGMSLSKTHTPSTGYMVSVYKVFDGDDKEKFERNWLFWTGARMIYRYLPPAAGLKRISLHKSVSPKGDKMYLLLCECSNLLNDITVWALLLPALRARLTGYTGIFKPIQTF